MLAGLRSLLSRLGVAALVAAAALLLRLALHPLLGSEVPFVTFFPAVLVAGYLGGRLAGLTATVLGGLAVVLCLFGWPLRPEALTTPELTSLIVFALSGGLMSLLSGWMWAAHRDAEGRAEHSRRQWLLLESVFDSAPVGLALFDKNRLALRVNPILAAEYGRPETELLGQPLGVLLPACVGTGELAERVFSGGPSVIEHELNGRLPLDSAGERSWLVSFFPVGETGRVALLVVDISKRRQREDALRHRAGELAETERRKDIFLAMLSHELRNPLAALRSAVDLLTLGQPAKPEVVRLFRRQMGMLTRLVDDLLDSARVRRGQIELRKHTSNLPEIIEAAIETVRTHIESRRHRVETVLPPRPLMVKADPVRLTQALANLLHNAARYTPPGGSIFIRVEAEPNEVVLRIQDTGIGIRPDMLGRIFELFQQGDQPDGQPSEGLGLGLTLVRRLIELHGGSVTAHSPGPGRGSTFEVRLPLLPMSATPSPHPPSRSTTPGGPATRRILVVDDNDDAAESLSLLLSVQGNEVKVVHDGPAAVQAVADWTPHVVILDIGLPGMDGYEVARELRQIYGAEAPRLIALTGFGHADDRQKGEDAGFDQYLVKPAGPEDLARAMQPG